MNKLLLITLCAFIMMPSNGRAEDDKRQEEEKISKMRVDCRFYEKEYYYCYASSKYTVRGTSIYNITYGVGCNHETIYNSSSGTTEPQSTSFDLIRPKTAAVPKILVYPERSLSHAGTYTAQLELDSHEIKNGICHVTNIYDEEPYALSLVE